MYYYQAMGDISVGTDGANLYAYVHRERVWGTNVAPPEDARRVIKPWDQRLSRDEYAGSGVDDQMIINVPFAVPVRVKAVILNTGSGDFAPRVRCGSPAVHFVCEPTTWR